MTSDPFPRRALGLGLLTIVVGDVACSGSIPEWPGPTPSRRRPLLSPLAAVTVGAGFLLAFAGLATWMVRYNRRVRAALRAVGAARGLQAESPTVMRGTIGELTVAYRLMMREKQTRIDGVEVAATSTSFPWSLWPGESTIHFGAAEPDRIAALNPRLVGYGPCTKSSPEVDARRVTYTRFPARAVPPEAQRMDGPHVMLLPHHLTLPHLGLDSALTSWLTRVDWRVSVYAGVVRVEVPTQEPTLMQLDASLELCRAVARHLPIWAEHIRAAQHDASFAPRAQPRSDRA